MGLFKFQSLQIILRDNFFLISIVVLALFLRLFLLNQFPIGITHDELNYIIAAKSLYWTGNFAPGTAPAILPVDMPNYTVVIAEIPALILTPLIGPFDFSLFLSRATGAIFSTFIILAVYFIAKHLTGNKLISLISALVMAVNPWSFLMGRTIFEVNFFVAFFLWGFLLLIRNKGWKIFYALPLYILGFLSYTGGQISFYLFMIITLIYHYLIFKPGKNSLAPYLAFFIAITFMLISYTAIVFYNQSFSSRGSELYTPFNQEINKIVNQERITAVPSPLNDLFINKLTVYSKGFLEKYLNTFSVNHLFLNGETRAAFSYQRHGTFYFIDLLFILIGLSFLFKTNLKSWGFVLAVLGAGVITSGLNVVEYSYSQRAGLMFPFLAILAGTGIGCLVTFFKSRLTGKLILASVTAVYLILFANLMHLYFFRFPVYASDGWFYQDRILSRYAQLTASQYPNLKIIVSTSEPKIIFQEYLFFTNVYNSREVAILNKKMSREDYSYQNIIFTDRCPTDLPNTVWIYDVSIKCAPSPENTLRITRFKDVYENYLIKQDVLCQNFELNSYVSPSAYNDFQIQNQDAQKFCQSWITAF